MTALESGFDRPFRVVITRIQEKDPLAEAAHEFASEQRVGSVRAANAWATATIARALTVISRTREGQCRVKVVPAETPATPSWHIADWREAGITCLRTNIELLLRTRAQVAVRWISFLWFLPSEVV